MGIRELASDVGVGMIGGYVGTQVMERVSMKLYELESEEDRKREEEVRPGPPFVIAARKTTEALGIELSEEQIQTLALYVFHYGLGMGWGPPYAFLRRWTDLSPVPAGLLTGAAMSLLVDEGMTPLLGFSAPNRDYSLHPPKGLRRAPGVRAGRRRHRRSPLLVGPQRRLDERRWTRWR